MCRARELARWWRSLPIVFRLLAVTLVLTVALNPIIRALPWTPLKPGAPRLVTADTTGHVVVFRKRVRGSCDSWGAILAGWERLHEHPGEPVYQPLLASGAKFQYPPTSVLLWEAVRPAGNWAFLVLNVVSYLLMWANAAFVALILLESCRRHLAPGQYARKAGGKWVLGAMAAALTLLFYPIVRSLD